ncbi:MAG: NFACT family protein [Candidatus Aenigmarchaeota archaeon]|nr:NFACT family protein [Candidatus Aenigmarchaeota archaeon]
MEELVQSRDEMSSLDMRFVVKELQQALIGGIIRKIYQYESFGVYQFLFEISTVQGPQWLFVDKNKIFLTKYKKEAPQTPPSFCMFLRKHLSNTKIKNISQKGFDRIIEIETENNFLVLELFSKGNLILCDLSHQIIMPLEMQKWRDREIKPKQLYKYPQSNLDPFGADQLEFKKTFTIQYKKVIVILATVFGFGKQYSKEICLLSGVDENKMTKDLSDDELSKIYIAVQNIGRSMPSPSIYLSTISSIELKSEKLKPQRMSTLSEAFDEFFLKKETTKSQLEQDKKQEEAEAKMQYIKLMQEKKIEKLGVSTKETRETADLIYTNYTLISSVVSKIRSSLSSGKNWPEIKEDLKTFPEVKSINENQGIVDFSLSDKIIKINFNKSIEQNAAEYYEESKKAKKKLEGAKTVVQQQIVIPKIQQEKQAAPMRKERKKWYEKFKWFISSSGRLVIAGRNETQNETIVKKHAEKDDFLLHADIHGAAFVLVKSQLPNTKKKKDEPTERIDEVTLKEAAEFSASNSKAWTRGVGTVDVSAFRPEQATKPDGSLPKGSFVIQGSRIWFRNMELKISVGIKIDKEKSIAKIICGPVMAVRKHANYFITIEPGDKELSHLAKEVKNKILLKSKPEDRYFIEKIQLSDIQNCIPSGRGEIV